MTRIGNNSSLIVETVDGAKRGNSRLVDTRRKRTTEQREDDLIRIAYLLTRECLSQVEIRTKLAQERPYSLSLSAIEADIKILHERWKKAYLGDMNELMGRELKRIDNLEAAYWDSYERSLSTKEVFKEEEEEGENTGMPQMPAGKFKRKKNMRELHPRDGSVQFLDGIKWCINQRCDILGLKAPLKSELTLDWRTEAVKQGLDPNRMFNDMVNQFIEGHLVEPSDNSVMNMDEAGLSKLLKAG